MFRSFFLSLSHTHTVSLSLSDTHTCPLHPPFSPFLSLPKRRTHQLAPFFFRTVRLIQTQDQKKNSVGVVWIVHSYLLDYTLAFNKNNSFSTFLDNNFSFFLWFVGPSKVASTSSFVLCVCRTRHTISPVGLEPETKINANTKKI